MGQKVEQTGWRVEWGKGGANRVEGRVGQRVEQKSAPL